MPFMDQPKPEEAYNPDDEQKALHFRIGTALQHIHEFAATFSAGDLVDEESGLTADDLFTALEVMEEAHRV